MIKIISEEKSLLQDVSRSEQFLKHENRWNNIRVLHETQITYYKMWKLHSQNWNVIISISSYFQVIKKKKKSLL